QGCELHGENLRELLHVGRADEQLGSGSLDDVFHVCLVHEHADRIDDGPGSQDTEQAGGEVDGIGYLEGDHIALTDASRCELSGYGLGEFFEFAVGGRRLGGELGDGGQCCFFFGEIAEDEVENVGAGVVQTRVWAGVDPG